MLSWTAPVIQKLQDLNQSPFPRLLSDLETSLLASSIYASVPGILIMSWLSNYKGRRLCLIIASCLFIVSYTLLAVTQNYAMLLASRVLSAYGSCTASIINALYIGEITSTKVRGILLTGLGIIQTIGSLLILSVGPNVSFSTTAYIGLIVSIIYLVVVLFIPESPVYYVIRGEKNKLKKVMQDLNRSDEIDDNVETQKSERNDINDWKELFTEKCNIKGLFIATVITMLQYGNGALIVTFFSTSIFEQAGSSIEPNLASVIIGCTQLSGSVIAPFFVEKSGRRPLLLTSTAICCGSMVVFGVYFYLSHIGAEVIQHFKWLPLVALAVFYLSNNMGFGVIPGTLTGEMFKSNVRSKGTALVIVISWIFGFAVTTLFNSTITRFGAHIIFWFFGLICGVAFLFTLFFVPETKGKSLVEITKMLNG
ncbi:unnamed protein product [Leptidea sinapis]|uniref:Major facilitator superfamily (MFS) profile domain-containing protein n=1 Tax=Leptidea sinapis TaxID=189913 RepID=A0A5E4QAH5_9NEOP|nr:unnamed protein product [Leptidea sinapis]